MALRTAVATASLALAACSPGAAVVEDLGACTIWPVDPGGEPLPSPYRVRSSAVGGDRIAFVDVRTDGFRDATASTRAPNGEVESADVDDASEIALALPQPGFWTVRWEDPGVGCIKEFTLEVVP